jgi:predicted metal-binding membrane protein
MSAGVATPPRVRDPAVALWTVAALAWAATLALAVTGGGRFGHHDVVVEQSTLPWPARFAAYLLVWVVMIGAMMLPTMVPMARLVSAVGARVAEPGPVRSALYVSYLAVWAAFGLLALAGDLGVHATVDRSPWLDGHSGLILAATLGLAGAFQFSALKERCLTACRDPLSMLWRHYRRGPRGAWRLGIRHALSCLGCCWALMLLMFATGVASVAWMLLLTAIMVAEKTTRWGARLATPVGVGLLAAAGLVALVSLGVAPSIGGPTGG